MVLGVVYYMAYQHCLVLARGEVCAQKTSLTPPLFLHVPGQESERSSLCLLEVSMLTLSRMFLLDFGNVSTVWYLFFVL